MLLQWHFPQPNRQTASSSLPLPTSSSLSFLPPWNDPHSPAFWTDVHCTPASSLCAQLWLIVNVQFMRTVSDPVQRTSSMTIGPLPWPNRAKLTAVAVCVRTEIMYNNNNNNKGNSKKTNKHPCHNQTFLTFGIYIQQ